MFVPAAILKLVTIRLKIFAAAEPQFWSAMTEPSAEAPLKKRRGSTYGLTAGHAEAMAWLQQNGLKLVRSTKTIWHWGHCQKAISAQQGVVLVWSCNRLDPQEIEDELRVLRKLAAAEPKSSHIQLPFSWIAWGTPAAVISSFSPAPLLKLDELLGQAFLTQETSLAVATQTCQGILYLHQLGIVHGDIHPEAVHVHLQGNNFVAKLYHFCAAKLLAVNSAATAASGNQAAEPATNCSPGPNAAEQQPDWVGRHSKYQAPETWEKSIGKGMQYTVAADIWSFGWLLGNSALLQSCVFRPLKENKSIFALSCKFMCFENRRSNSSEQKILRVTNAICQARSLLQIQ